MTGKEWEDRQKIRADEIEAVNKAISILDADDAHATFSRSFPSLLQASSSNQRSKALAVLKSVTTDNNRLSTLATRLQLDPFVKVKAAVDELIAELKAEKAAEIKKRDFCRKEFNENAASVERKNVAKDTLQGQLDELDLKIQGLDEAIATLQKEIKDINGDMKTAGEDREAENKNFQQTVADHKKSRQLLNSALAVLKDFYTKRNPVLVQREDATDFQAPEGFTKFEKNAQGSGVMGMLEKIMADSKAAEAEAVRDEQTQQKAYEEVVQQSTQEIEQKQKEIVERTETRSKSQAAHMEATNSQEVVVVELDHLSNYKTELHQNCDFLLANFEMRQTARDDEVEALRQVNAILSGSNFSS